MIRGNKKRIDLGSSEFRRFIENNNFYVDKTKFIENAVNQSSSVLLFTRHRRTGKSLNLDTLRTFLDCKQDTKHLFSGLYIENSPVFSRANKHPVICLNFKELKSNDYKRRLKNNLKNIARYYLKEEQFNSALIDYFNNNHDTAGALLDLTKNLHEIYGVKPYILIDEYDKILMDNVYSAEYENLRGWITDIFDAALKDNHSLEKAVLTGVTRISKESMFSGLNNLSVFDVFTSGVFDRDFSLTENEISEVLTPEELGEVRDWYNNTRVGEEKLYNIYSVMSYLQYGKLDNYWGNSGTLDMLINLINKARGDRILEMIEDRDAYVTTELQPRLSLKNIASANLADSQFYSLAVQAGYLTYDPETKPAGIRPAVYRVYIPNLELQSVWRDFILEFVVETPGADLRGIFKNIGDTEDFSEQLKNFIDYRLSFFDTDKQEPEKIYHVFLFGMALGAKFKCESNRESGFGRYDLLIEGDAFYAVLEFKRAENLDGLEKKAAEALYQIDKQKYYARVKNNKPIYKVGIACYKTECAVKTVLH